MTATTSIQEKKSARSGRGLVLFRGLGTLALLVIAGRGLLLLGHFQAGQVELRSILDDHDNTVWVIFRKNATRRTFEDPTVIITRVPLDVLPLRNIIRFRDQRGVRVLPPGGIVLVHRSRRIELVEFSPPFRRVLHQLQKSPPELGESLPRWFAAPGVRKDLERAGLDLDEFWK